MRTYIIYDEVTDFMPRPINFDAMIAPLRAKLAAKNGRKHIWMKRDEFEPVRLYANHGIRLKADRGEVRIPTHAARQVLKACEKRYEEETVAAVTRELDK